jgi:hypothetical protein
MLSNEEHCKLLTLQLLERLKYIMDGFKLFIQVFTALVGGAVAVRLQYGEKTPPSFARLGDALAIIIFIATAALILENLRAWYGYRNALSAFAGLNETNRHIIPRPRAWWTARIEIIMILVMIAATCVFLVFNTLRISN